MTNSKQQAPQGVYIHIPFCRSRCAYCAFTSSCVGEYDMRAYVRALREEIGARVCGEVDTIYLGGGTPSVLPRGLLGDILRTVSDIAHVSAHAEVTVEANPDSCTDDFLREASACGCNRISIGVQSFEDAVLRAAGRRHTAAQAHAAIERAFSRGFAAVSCDLMIGLPSDDRAGVLRSVRAAAQAGCKHLSLYALGIEEGTPLYERGYTYDEDEAAETYAQAHALLRTYDLLRYEVSNFAAAGYESRHNRKYWRREPYIGVGVAAHSFDGALRKSNTTDIAAYIAGERGERVHPLTTQETLEELLMLGLRTREGVRLSDIRAVDESWERRKSAEIDALARDGFLEADGATLRLREEAYYVMNEVIVRLF